MTDPPAQRETEGPWTELHRRKVVQWGVAYAAGAWGLLQGLEYLSSTFEWPRRIQQFATLAMLCGLPIVLIIAWYHGDRGRQRVSSTELAILTLLFMLGGGVFWLYQRGATAPGATAPAIVASPLAAAADRRPSIAVLPFENRSRVEDDAFFVDGIHDDILTQLAKVSAMKVVSRTSVERFRDTHLPMKEIAEQLGVTRIVEGGVQRAGDRVRITVQLIDAATDAHLWAENYDRELTASNIFAIQSEVATAIAAAMTATLTPAERARVNAVPTQNLAAWEAYQLGRRQLARRTRAALTDAENLLREAIDRDPGFAPPYAALADAIWLNADAGGLPIEPAIVRAEPYLDEALRLDPDLAEAVTTQAKFAQLRGEYARAEAGFRRAIDLNPNYPTAHQWYSYLLGLQGRDDESSQSMQRAAELDPMSVLLQSVQGAYLVDDGQADAGFARLNRAHAIDPLSPLPYATMGQILAESFGRIADAIPFQEKARELDTGRSQSLNQLARLYLELGDDARARLWLDQANGAEAQKVTAYLHLYRGERDEALACARRALAQEPRDGDALALLRNADLEAGDLNSAHSRYAQSFPELLKPQIPQVDRMNYGAAIDVALVLQRMGEQRRAVELLDRTDVFVRRLNQRKGIGAYGIADARIRALRGDKPGALAALRSAEKDRWRGPFWRYYRDFDPALASVRNEKEFAGVFAGIERDLARQRAALAARPKNAPLDFVAPR